MTNEQTATGLLETSGQRKAVKAYLAQNPKARAIDIARDLGCTEAFALSALSDEIWAIPKADLSKVLAEIKSWERVMALIRNEDAVAEVEVPGHSWYESGDWLNWIGEGYNLHIRIAATDQIMALIRPGKRGRTYSFNFINEASQVFCRFYARTPAARERFLSFCRAYLRPDLEPR